MKLNRAKTGLGLLVLALASAGVFFVIQEQLDMTSAVTAGEDEQDGESVEALIGATPHVSVMETRRIDVPVTYDFVGTTEASHRVEIRARIRGFLEERHFEEGGLVQAGDLLYTIDAAPFEADLRIARANLEQKRARMELASRETDRLRTLVDEKIISQSEFDQTEAALIEARAAVELAQAELDKAELELGYTRIRAPFTGFVEESFKEVGSLVDDGPNSLLTEALRVDPLDVHFRISESQYRSMEQEIKRGKLRRTGEHEPHIELTLVDGMPYEKRGTINFLNPSIDRQTGTVGYRAQIDNAEGELKPGQFVQVQLKGLERPGSLTIPQAAVSQAPSGSFVYVVTDDSTAEMRTVELANWSGTDWIITSGLEAGERIITSGLSRVRAGEKVEVGPSPAESGGPGGRTGKTE